MALLQLVAFFTLAACCMARSPPGKPFPAALLQTPLSCNDSEVLAAAGFALQNINRDQKEGYVLSLSRVHDVRRHYQEEMGSVFYLTLDVLETVCHVLSRKAQKDCSPRILHESVYGQCKAMFHINKPRRVLYLLAYNCTVRPVSRRKIHSVCPDCPSPVDLSNPSVLEAATESLGKFNREHPSKQYSLVKVTKATSQWVVGPAYFVEYLIKESPCSQSQASCSLQPSDSEAQVPGGENSAVTQESKKLPEAADEASQKNTAPTSSPSIMTPRGSVQHLPELNEPEGSEEKSPEEAFPVQLDLTTNPQGDTLDVSFLYLGPEEKKLVVLPFPGKGRRSAECPGPAPETSPMLLPP